MKKKSGSSSRRNYTNTTKVDDNLCEKMKQNWNFFRRDRMRRESRNTVVRSNSFTLQFGPRFLNQEQTLVSFASGGAPSKEVATARSAAALSEQVRYIFSTAVRRRPTSLRMLQKPLKTIYLAYINNQYASVPAILEVTSEGLRCQHAKRDGSDVIDTFNPFQTIAYWAAVQCVVRSDSIVHDDEEEEEEEDDDEDGDGGDDDDHDLEDDRDDKNECTLRLGFFPFAEDGRCLVEEPQSTVSRHRKSSKINTDGFIWLKLSERNRQLLSVEHQPFFACVMRPANQVPHLLHCHIFLCSTAGQAVSLAATLYASLSMHTGNLQINQDNILRIHELRNVGLHKQHEVIRCKTLPCREKPDTVGNPLANRSRSFSRIVVRLRRFAMGCESTPKNKLKKQQLACASAEEANTHRNARFVTYAKFCADDDDQQNQKLKCHVIDGDECDGGRETRSSKANAPRWLRFFLELTQHQAKVSKGGHTRRSDSPRLISGRLRRTRSTICTQPPTANSNLRKVIPDPLLPRSKSAEITGKEADHLHRLEFNASSADEEEVTTTTTTANAQQKASKVNTAYPQCNYVDDYKPDSMTLDLKEDLTSTTSNSAENKSLRHHQMPDETACLKKDAEIMSIFEQLVEYQQIAAIDHQVDEANENNTTVEQPITSTSNAWGCSTFLP